jgi:hypothetical protein
MKRWHQLNPATRISLAVFAVALMAACTVVCYPLKLVTAKGHRFARWESPDGRERFNIEASNKGLNTFPDEYYKSWPIPMTEADLRSGHYLRSLTMNEEQALFLQTRGLCLQTAGRLQEAPVDGEIAHRLATEGAENALLIVTLNPN